MAVASDRCMASPVLLLPFGQLQSLGIDAGQVMGVDEYSGRARQLHMYLCTCLALLNNAAIKTECLTRSGCKTVSLASLTVTEGFSLMTNIAGKQLMTTQNPKPIVYVAWQVSLFGLTGLYSSKLEYHCRAEDCLHLIRSKAKQASP